jgi:hypothetical protein
MICQTHWSIIVYTCGAGVGGHCPGSEWTAFGAERFRSSFRIGGMDFRSKGATEMTLYPEKDDCSMPPEFFLGLREEELCFPLNLKCSADADIWVEGRTHGGERMFYHVRSGRYVVETRAEWEGYLENGLFICLESTLPEAIHTLERIEEK